MPGKLTHMMQRHRVPYGFNCPLLYHTRHYPRTCTNNVPFISELRMIIKFIDVFIDNDYHTRREENFTLRL